MTIVGYGLGVDSEGGSSLVTFGLGRVSVTILIPLRATVALEDTRARIEGVVSRVGTLGRTHARIPREQIMVVILEDTDTRFDRDPSES